MGQLQVNNASIYYEIKGSGHPLVLISGFTCDHAVWSPIVNKLAEHFRVVLFDNRGIGQTKDDASELSADLLAKDVLGLIKGLQLKKPHIIGQSMGGTIAQKLATSYPEEIGKLGLMVTTSKWREAMLLSVRSQLLLKEQEVDPGLILGSTIPWLFGEGFLKKPGNIEMFKDFKLKAPNPQSLKDYIRQMAILEGFDGRGELHRIKAPTFVMYGKEDIVAPPSCAEFLAKQIQNSTLEGFDGAHSLILEDKEKLLDSILQFLLRGG
jgi:3-oxoadipate enol-lactonase